MGTAGWAKKSDTKRKRVIKELVEGRDFATQLQNLLKKPTEDRGSVSAKELLIKIMGSFTQTISVLSSCDGDRTLQDSSVGRKGPVVNRRGHYKRRKTSDSWVTVSPTVEDGYAWRKYGQKEILNAIHPRCYYRCTHKYDQGCRATKQIQRMEDNPNMYHITYFGHHTCKHKLNPPPIISDSDPMESYILNFGSKIPYKENHPSRPTIPMVIKKEKNERENELSDTISSLDSTLWQDLNLKDLDTNLGSGHEDLETLFRSGDFQIDDMEFFLGS